MDVEDTYGNILTGDTSSVTLTVASGPGSIGGTDTVAAVAGVATFNNVTIIKPGVTRSPRQTRAILRPPPAASPSAQPRRPRLSTPATQQRHRRRSQQPGNYGRCGRSVRQYRHVGFSSNVTLSVASGGGSVSGTSTVAASSGVATFSNLIVDTAGATRFWRPTALLPPRRPTALPSAWPVRRSSLFYNSRPLPTRGAQFLLR